MTARRGRWIKLVPTATLTIVPFAVFQPQAGAFFPPVFPTQNPDVVVVPPVSPPPFIVTPPPTIVVPPVVPPPIVVPPIGPPPSTVPEPSTLVAGIAGLTAAAGWTARRRKKNQQG